MKNNLPSIVRKDFSAKFYFLLLLKSSQAKNECLLTLLNLSIYLTIVMKM